jgi:hypothetical protein
MVVRVSALVRVVVVVAVGATLTGPARAQGAPAETNAAEATRAEAMLGGELELLLTENERLCGRGLKAEVAGGTVTLSGAVVDEADRQLAERIVRHRGIARVDNEIALEEPPPPKSQTAAGTEPMTNEEREDRRRTAARVRAQAAAQAQPQAQPDEAPATSPAPTTSPPPMAPPPAPPAHEPHPDDDL